MGAGGAVCAAIQANTDFRNCTFTNNTATSGGAMHISKRCDVLVDSDTCSTASVRLFPDVQMSYNKAIGGAGGAVYALTIDSMTLYCSAGNGQQQSGTNSIVLNSTTLTNGQWPRGSSGCAGWMGNDYVRGGYGAVLATGYSRVALAGADIVTNYGSNTAFEDLELQLYDSFGTAMTRGSYEVSNTQVKVRGAGCWCGLCRHVDGRQSGRTTHCLL